MLLAMIHMSMRNVLTLLGIKVVSLDELIKQSDFITVHMPLTPKTKGMLNKDNIAKNEKWCSLNKLRSWWYHQ
mgnify:CR=1 FL=1